MKYEEYKDSGVEWIGEVPSHWEVIPIKRTGSFENGLTYSPTDICDENGVLVLRSSNIQNDKLNFEDNVYVAKCPLSLLVDPGDIIICSRNGSASLVGKCAMVEENITATYGAFMMRYRPICKSNKVFSYYLLQTALKCYKGLYSTTTINQLTKGAIGQIYVSYPPLAEQEAIATYLDEKCGEINRAIDVQRKKTELLGELKQTIITDAVTKGLAPNAPMKDSGVEWIGEVPSHWEVMRLRFACEFRNGYTPSKANPDFWENGSIPWYRMEDIRESGRFLNEAKQYITRKAVKGNGLFEAGSFILATTATIGEHAVLIADSLANQQFTNLKIRKSLSNRLSRDFFFYYLFVIDDYCKSTTRTATFPAVNMDDLKNFGVTIPPLQEQQAIVAHIEDEVGQIDSRISRANRRIELLEELKQSIITEAVTGKIKVC